MKSSRRCRPARGSPIAQRVRCVRRPRRPSGRDVASGPEEMPQRLLIVDDEPATRTLMQAYLAPEALQAYRACAVFMELRLDAATAASQRPGVIP